MPLRTDPILEPGLSSARSRQPKYGKPRSISEEGLNRVLRFRPTMKIRGELSCEEDLCIEGEFVGTIVVDNHRFTSGASSSITADVRAGEVVIRGRITGNITARDRVTLARTAIVDGNIDAARISFEEGCDFSGQVTLNPEKRSEEAVR